MKKRSWREIAKSFELDFNYIPVSINDYLSLGVRNINGKPKAYTYETKKSNEFKTYLHDTSKREVAKQHWDINDTISGSWYMDIYFRFPKKRMLRDKDPNNYLKVLLDGLTGIVYNDDNNILTRIQDVRFVDKENVGFKLILSRKE